MATPSSRRIGALLALAGVLASLTVVAAAAPAAAGPDCTYKMVEELSTYDPSGITVNQYPAGPVLAGTVVCGGPGADGVSDLDAGVFLGRGGNDSVQSLKGGRFVGAAGTIRWTR